jgi:hypothetical protein
MGVCLMYGDPNVGARLIYATQISFKGRNIAPGFDHI